MVVHAYNGILVSDEKEQTIIQATTWKTVRGMSTDGHWYQLNVNGNPQFGMPGQTAQLRYSTTMRTACRAIAQYVTAPL